MAKLRESEQQLLVEEYATTSSMEKAAVVKQMVQQEKVKSSYLPETELLHWEGTHATKMDPHPQQP